MAQINLLKQNTAPTTNFWEFLPKFFVRVFAVVLLGLIIYYIYLFISSSSIDSQTLKLQAQIQNDQQKALNDPQRKELLTRQQQLKSFDGLVAQHIYWSQVMPKLASVTLKTATYSSLKISTDGQLTLSVKVPSLGDLDKYLQVFDNPDVNKYFSNVRIGGYHKVEGDKASSALAFDVIMEYNPALIQYGGIK